MNRPTALVALAVLLTGPTGALPAGAGRQVEQVAQVETKQRDIKGQTLRTATDLDAIINEFDDAGLGHQADLATLKAIRSVLTRLSDKDMEKVLSLLQAARLDTDRGHARHTAVDAYSGQKNIILQLRQLVLEYQRQQQLLEMSLRFAALAERQNGNLHTVQHLVKGQQLGKLNPWEDLYKAQLRLQGVEQTAIHDETAAVVHKLAELAEADAQLQWAHDNRTKTALDLAHSSNLENVISQAATELANINLLAAATQERTARDQLRQLARLVAPPRSPDEILEQAARQLAGEITEQTAVLAHTGAVKEGDRDQCSAIEDHEADLVDNTDVVRKDIAELAPDAATDLDAALASLQETRGTLMQARREPSLKTEEVALQKLTEARERILAQIQRRDHENQADKAPTDPIADAKDLKAKVDELRKKQDELKQQTQAQNDANKLAPLAARQADLSAQAKDLLAHAAVSEPLATPQLKKAAADMDAAQAALETTKNHDEAANAQQRAIEDLANASQDLDKQVAHDEQARKDMEKLNAADQKLAKMIAEEAGIQAQTAKVAAQKDAAKMPDAAAAAALKPVTQRQETNAKTGEQTKADLPESARESADALNQANNEMNAAKQALERGDPKDADQTEHKAIADLIKAKDALDKQIAADQAEQHQPPAADPNKDNALANLQNQLENAEKQLDQAMDAMTPAGAAELAKEETALAHDVQQARDKGSKAPAQLDAAQAAAEQGAEHLAKGEMHQAAQSLAAAHDALDQAAKAEAQAKAEEAKADPAADAAGAKPDAAANAKPDQAAGAPPAAQPDPAAGQEKAAAAAAAKPDAGQEAGTPSGSAPEPPNAAAAELAQHQAAIQSKLQQLLAQPVAKPALDQAGAELSKLSAQVAQLAAQDAGILPPLAPEAMAEAAQAMAEAAAQANAGQPEAAQDAGHEAQTALENAEAALGMAAAGLHAKVAGKPASGKPMPGQPRPGQAQVEQAKKGAEQNPHAKGVGDRQDTQARGDGDPARTGPRGASSFVTLPPRDRAAIQQSRSEKYPEEYGAMIEQYFKNISDQESAK